MLTRIHTGRYAAFLHYVSGYHWILRIDADCVLESRGGGWLDGLQHDSKVGVVATLGMDSWHVIVGMQETFVNLSLSLGLAPFPKEWNSPLSSVFAIDVQWAQQDRGLQAALRTVNETRCVWLNRCVFTIPLPTCHTIPHIYCGHIYSTTAFVLYKAVYKKVYQSLSDASVFTCY
jgi:hypothetical protein